MAFAATWRRNSPHCWIVVATSGSAKSIGGPWTTSAEMDQGKFRLLETNCPGWIPSFAKEENSWIRDQDPGTAYLYIIPFNYPYHCGIGVDSSIFCTKESQSSVAATQVPEDVWCCYHHPSAASGQEDSVEILGTVASRSKITRSDQVRLSEAYAYLLII